MTTVLKPRGLKMERVEADELAVPLPISIDWRDMLIPFRKKRRRKRVSQSADKRLRKLRGPLETHQTNAARKNCQQV